MSEKIDKEEMLKLLENLRDQRTEHVDNERGCTDTCSNGGCKHCFTSDSEGNVVDDAIGSLIDSLTELVW